MKTLQGSENLLSVLVVKKFCNSMLWRTLMSDFPKPCQILKSCWAPMEKLYTWNSLCYDLHQSVILYDQSTHLLGIPYICTVMSGWENMRGWHQGSWKGPSLFKKMFSAENSSTFCMLFFILMFQMDLPFQRWQESIIASLRREKAKFEVLDYISISVFSLCLRFWLHDRHKLFFCIAG